MSGLKKHSAFVFTLCTFVLGFMLAVQFHTTMQPVERDTRDIWELREDLEKEQKRQIELNEEIRRYKMLLNQYRQNSDQKTIAVMEEAFHDLQEEAGLTAKTGEGIILSVEPLFSDELLGQEVPALTPELLLRLVNQLNSYQVEALAIADQRMVATSAIREVNGQTYVNNRPLPELPIQIKLMASNTKKVFNQINASPIIDEFAKENLSLIPEMAKQLQIPAYERHLTVKYMEQVKEDS